MGQSLFQDLGKYEIVLDWIEATPIRDIASADDKYEKFAGKTVFCNCDDPFESNFVKYFLMNFNGLGLKELIATGYKTSPVQGTELGERGKPYALRVTETKPYLWGTQRVHLIFSLDILPVIM